MRLAALLKYRCRGLPVINLYSFYNTTEKVFNFWPSFLIVIDRLNAHTDRFVTLQRIIYFRRYHLTSRVAMHEDKPRSRKKVLSDDNSTQQQDDHPQCIFLLSVYGSRPVLNARSKTSTKTTGSVVLFSSWVDWCSKTQSPAAIAVGFGNFFFTYFATSALVSYLLSLNFS